MKKTNANKFEINQEIQHPNIDDYKHIKELMLENRLYNPKDKPNLISKINEAQLLTKKVQKYLGNYPLTKTLNQDLAKIREAMKQKNTDYFNACHSKSPQNKNLSIYDAMSIFKKRRIKRLKKEERQYWELKSLDYKNYSLEKADNKVLLPDLHERNSNRITANANRQLVDKQNISFKKTIYLDTTIDTLNTARTGSVDLGDYTTTTRDGNISPIMISDTQRRISSQNKYHDNNQLKIISKRISQRPSPRIIGFFDSKRYGHDDDYYEEIRKDISRDNNIDDNNNNEYINDNESFSSKRINDKIKDNKRLFKTINKKDLKFSTSQMKPIALPSHIEQLFIQSKTGNCEKNEMNSAYIKPKILSTPKKIMKIHELKKLEFESKNKNKNIKDLDCDSPKSRIIQIFLDLAELSIHDQSPNEVDLSIGIDKLPSHQNENSAIVHEIQPKLSPSIFPVHKRSKIQGFSQLNSIISDQTNNNIFFKFEHNLDKIAKLAQIKQKDILYSPKLSTYDYYTYNLDKSLKGKHILPSIFKSFIKMKLGNINKKTEIIERIYRAFNIEDENTEYEIDWITFYNFYKILIEKKGTKDETINFIIKFFYDDQEDLNIKQFLDLLSLICPNNTNDNISMRIYENLIEYIKNSNLVYYDDDDDDDDNLKDIIIHITTFKQYLENNFDNFTFVDLIMNDK